MYHSGQLLNFQKILILKRFDNYLFLNENLTHP